MLAVGLILLGIISRVIPHAWNFSPILAVALFSGCYLKKRDAYLVPLVLLFISDMILGWHPTVFVTWSSIALIVWIGKFLKENKNFKMIFAGSVAAAVLFYVITNFGVWLVYYPRTAEGLLRCFTLAIPFFRNSLISTIVFSYGMIGIYEWTAVRVRDTRYEKILLVH